MNRLGKEVSAVPSCSLADTRRAGKAPGAGKHSQALASAGSLPSLELSASERWSHAEEVYLWLCEKPLEQNPATSVPSVKEPAGRTREPRTEVTGLSSVPALSPKGLEALSWEDLTSLALRKFLE